MNMNFDFNNPTRILFGSGKLDELGSQPMPGKKALLLMSGGRSAKASGAYDRTIEQLKKAGVEVAEFAKVMENPVKEMVMEGAAFARENGCDFIVALGGGAALHGTRHERLPSRSASWSRTDHDFKVFRGILYRKTRLRRTVYQDGKGDGD